MIDTAMVVDLLLTKEERKEWDKIREDARKKISEFEMAVHKESNEKIEAIKNNVKKRHNLFFEEEKEK